MPLIYSYYVPPAKIMTTVCSGSLSTHDMLNYAILRPRLRDHDHRHSAHGVQLSRGLDRTRARARLRGSLYRPDDRLVPSPAGSKKSTTEFPVSQKAAAAGAGDGVQSATQDILRQHQREKSADAERKRRDQSAQSIQRPTARLQLPSARRFKSARPPTSASTE